MPIKLNDLVANATTVKKTYTPKFFSGDLTGNGKKTGLLNENLNPLAVVQSGVNIYNPCTTSIYGKRTTSNNGCVVKHINVNLEPIYCNGARIDTPDPGNSVTVATYSAVAALPAINVICSVEPECIVIEETKAQNGANRRTFVSYLRKLYFQEVGNTNQQYVIGKNAFVQKIGNPADPQEIANLFNSGVALIYNAHRAPYRTSHDDRNAYDDYLANYNLYNEICRLSERWQTTIDKDIGYAIEEAKTDFNMCVTLGETIFPAMENYQVPLEIYRKIYDHIKRELPAAEATRLCKSNMNLLLSDTLENLSKNKSKIQTFTPETDPKKLPAGFRKLSREQQNAVSTAEPLVLVQAGAGCGKSHTIMQRMDFMIASGVNRDDITVLSFTNAAADNITNRNPGVHSMTIATMIHTIYSVNFPLHRLCGLTTLDNQISILYPTARTDVVDKFQSIIREMQFDEKAGYTRMNNFIEEHYDEVIDILNKTQMTTLALEIIICYQKIGELQEPDNVRSKYLILDEVQDNSIFEFIYTLKYVDKHNESLFIVGDCSQTLYAFRAANPMAMNILESSGVFATYPLQINFRSNQEILDFANVMLRDIEANQFANIQLQANSLANVTEQSFRDKVHLHYEQLSKIGDWDETMGPSLAKNAKAFIDAKLAAGEQVAFLAFTRNNVYKIQKTLQTMYPGKKIVTLVPEKQYDSAIFTTFIRKYWDEIRFAPAANSMVTIAHAITNRLPYLVRDSAKVLPLAQKMLGDWQTKYIVPVTSWYHQYDNGQISARDFFDNIKETLIDFEISVNAVHQALLSARNAEQKTSDEVKDANFILSTIHSAKGLEFQNTVVIYRNDSAMSEEDKRMYYVALTRAMKSEFVLAYGTLKNPQIEADYKTVVSELRAKAIAASKVQP